jgi:hypothetical protein
MMTTNESWHLSTLENNKLHLHYFAHPQHEKYAFIAMHEHQVTVLVIVGREVLEISEPGCLSYEPNRFMSFCQYLLHSLTSSLPFRRKSRAR